MRILLADPASIRKLAISTVRATVHAPEFIALAALNQWHNMKGQIAIHWRVPRRTKVELALVFDVRDQDLLD